MNAVRWMGRAAASLLLACAPVADEPAPLDPPAWQPPSARGPYEAGVMTLEISRDELPDLTVEVWYPAQADGEPVVYEASGLVLAGEALADATPDPRGGPRPVVAFSHGFGGIRFQSWFLTEHLARHGFVVVAPDHPGTSLVDLQTSETAFWAARRPRDISDAVDALQGLDIDVETEFAAVGHSFGAWTSLVVAGGEVDAAAFAAACAVDDPPAACRFFEDQTLSEDDVLAWARPDPRAVASVMLTPGAWYAFGERGLETVRQPLVIGGTLDDELPYEPETVGTFDALPRPKALATLEGAGHWAFTDLCAVVPLSDCAGPPDYMDPAYAHVAVREIVTGYLQATLVGDARGEVALTARDAVTWSDLRTP